MYESRFPPNEILALRKETRGLPSLYACVLSIFSVSNGFKPRLKVQVVYAILL